MITRVIRVASADQAEWAARQGADALRAGQLVGFATETVYGLAGMATSARAMEALRDLKSRPARPFSVHIAQPSDAHRYVQRLPAAAERLIARSWPGPITVLVPTGGRLADERLSDPALYSQLCWEDTIGLRCPDEPVAQAMLAAVDEPVVAPSANLAGERSPRSAEDVLASLDGRIDLLIDSGPTRYGSDSTIVSFAGDGWKVVREGVHDERSIRKLLGRTILLVCTGNTCRSAMAEGLARKLLAGQMGCPEAQLGDRGVEVVSAGVMAAEGARASPEAVEAAGERSADIARHRSRKLTQELIASADLILCMTDFHVQQVVAMVPGSAGKTERLSAQADIPDPIGAGPAVYRRTAEKIEAVLKERLEKGTL